ncbi:MAG: hypothetical protein HEP71_00860 [Roseivirga sp.]|nr:hypothetical protein [Roseivirga sp.]
MKIIPLLSKAIICISLFCISNLTYAQATYSVKKVSQNVYIFTELWEGANNGNMGVVIGDKDVMLINSMMMNSAPSLEKEIQKITNKPIKYVVNSDSDPYNHHANKYFADRGAVIYSHENIKYSPAYYDILFSDRISISMGDEVVVAYHTPAHTLDHVDVYLEKSNVLFMSDGFKSHWLTPAGPHGLDGLLSGIDQALSLSDENTIIVSGNTSKNPEHFLSNKKDLIRMREIHSNFVARVHELNQAGLSVESIETDKELNGIVEDLEAYPKFRQYLKYRIIETLEEDFANSHRLSEEERMTYPGVYDLNDTRFIEIIIKNDKLFAREKSAFYFELIPYSKTKFGLKGATNNYLTFQFSPNGKVVSLTPLLEKNGWWSNILKAEKHLKR